MCLTDHVGGLAEQGTTALHLFLFWSLRGQARPPPVGCRRTVRAWVSQPRPQEAEQGDQAAQGETRQSAAAAGWSCWGSHSSLTKDSACSPRNCGLAWPGWHAVRHSCLESKLFMLPPHPV